MRIDDDGVVHSRALRRWRALKNAAPLLSFPISIVIHAKAGIQMVWGLGWMPAFAGITRLWIDGAFSSAANA
jgi:hypothetical protein